jgi:general secretion pathway protein I
VRAGLHVGQGGFSLLEILVAFAIMAISLGMLYRASGGTVRALGDTEQAARASVLARSLLDSHDNVPETGWNESGESAGIAWQVRSEPYPTDRNGPAVPKLQRVQLLLTWADARGARQIEYSTLLPQAKPTAGSQAR